VAPSRHAGEHRCSSSAPITSSAGRDASAVVTVVSSESSEKNSSSEKIWRSASVSGTAV
jgi:hypothetical protein